MIVLIVGLGSIGKKHVGIIQDMVPDAQIFALRMKAGAPSIDGVKNIYGLKELPRKPTFAIISNPTSLHAGTIVILSELGCPLFIEKPLFHELPDVNKMLVQQISQAGIITYVACNMRFHPILQYLKENFPKQGKINEVNVYCGSNLQNWRPEQDYRDSYSSKPEMGGGVHLDLVHELDYTYWLFGRPSRVMRSFSSKSSLEINSVDYANYCLTYHNFNASIVLNYYRPKPKRTIEIVFENVIWNCNLLNCEIHDENDNLIFMKDDFNPVETYISQMKYFLEAIKSERSTFNDIRNGVDVLEICLD
jgi:predicted dehydrogenase